MIVSDIPPHRGIVEHGRTGLVVPVDDPARFAEALLDLLQSAERRQALGCLARQNVHSSFLIERYVRAVLEPLQSSGRQARPGLRMDSRRRLAAGLHGVDPPVCAVACVGDLFPATGRGLGRGSEPTSSSEDFVQCPTLRQARYGAMNLTSAPP